MLFHSPVCIALKIGLHNSERERKHIGGGIGSSCAPGVIALAGGAGGEHWKNERVKRFTRRELIIIFLYVYYLVHYVKISIL